MSCIAVSNSVLFSNRLHIRLLSGIGLLGLSLFVLLLGLVDVEVVLEVVIVDVLCVAGLNVWYSLSCHLVDVSLI